MSEVISESGESIVVPTTEEIEDLLSGAAQRIREYSASQKEMWQQLPYLALQAEGNGGFGSLWKVYEHGLYEVSGGTSGLCGTYVDCANGNILSQSGEVDYGRFESDRGILAAWNNGRGFDASKPLEHFRKQAVRPHASFGKPEAEVRQWRHETATRLGLLSVYQRVEVAAAVAS